MAPLNLTRQSFLDCQATMFQGLVSDIAKELLNYEIPGVAAIFGGVDLSGPHIYVVHNNEVNCMDTVGFAAIGIGGRQHLVAIYVCAARLEVAAARNATPDIYAKRKSEVAPGVGGGTDMVMVGPALGSLTPIGAHVMEN